MTARWAATLLGLAALGAAPAHAAESTVRRFALLAGANDGGNDRVPLVYAGSDARSMAAVLARYGGVNTRDVVVLVDPDHAAMKDAFADLNRRIAAAGPAARTEVVVYYSGHSDASGLLLAGERMPYRELRSALDALPADVRVAILDSCASGALVRGKGGAAAPAFLLDEGNVVEGHAFLTSSSADEISQEADALGGSFFTHALVTGLRGGADTDLDGRVTLNEAYRFAYDETLARTEGTRYGPQHAAFDIQLNGSGDLVMTDLRQRGAGLQLGAEVQGLVMVRDSSGRLVAELRKAPGRPVALGLEPGQYSVTAREEGGTWRATATVPAGGSTTLERSAFTGFALADARARGDVPPEAAPGAAPHREPDRVVAFAATLLPDLNLESDRERVELKTGVGVVATRSWRMDGTALALGATFTDDGGQGMQGAIGLNHAGGDMRGMQGAVGANVAFAELQGVQASAGGNWAQDLRGLQGAAVANVVEQHLRGLQLSAGANIVGARAEGLQASAGANFAQELSGLQLSAGANVALQAHGAQIGLVNVSAGEDDRAFKLGLVNVSGDIQGSTVGLVNVARSMEGAPIGLINIVRDGIFDGELWADSTGAASIGLKTGGKRLYTVLAAGAIADLDAPAKTPADHLLVTGAGMGVRAGPPRVPVDVDLGLWSAIALNSQTELTLIPRLRVSVGFKINEHFTPFVGADLNLGIAVRGDPSPWPLWVEAQPIADGLRFWPGGSAGIRF